MDIIRDEDPHDLSKRGGRLDMSHGFLHHIRRNQIARDSYDKEVKNAKELQRKVAAPPRRPRRPDIAVYNPRRRDESESGGGVETEEWNDSGSSTETEAPGTELFWLDYQDDCGTITSFIVHKEDKPDDVVKRVVDKNDLDPAMRAALRLRVRKEMDKRRDKR
ncbi:UPF0561 protein C2orf68 homolog [Gadus chalcogrammus]|uniref:UPF0561 protein C2orf68 homolog n=1 Tax=Gadus chalcogrammus TaxID=1042646 RepID=UPI0024C2B79E|nr:UPF0561 protein C2orf68 homolog [Gadus chalcogrammus]XP_056448624.1 UPF0561 protein C2orf68 homolog [Gadus chalcogrammus]